MSFEQSIQQWVSLDNQLKILHEKTCALREKKADLSANILSYAEKNKLQNSVVNISDGRLKFVETRVAPQLSFKYVEKCLGEIIENPREVKRIIEYLKTSRETKTVHEIKRYGNTSNSSSNNTNNN